MTVNIGILGFAHSHVKAYCQQWAQRPELGINVAAGWDHDADRLAAAVKAHGVQPFDNLPQLLRRDDICSVVIAAETSRHAELVEKAAAAGKAIILQKPLALTMEEGRRIVAAVGRAAVRFTLAWQMRVDPQNVRMKEIVQRRELGRVYMVRRRHCLSTHLWGEWFENSWHVKPQLNRGMWADDACHAIDFLYWMLGEPVSVMAEIATLRSPKVPDDHGVAVFRWADGTMGEVACSFVAGAGENTTEIIAENGVVIQSYGDQPSCGARPPEEAPPEVPPEAPPEAIGLKWYVNDRKQWVNSEIPTPPQQSDRIAALAEPLAEFLHGRRPPLATAEEGLAVLRMTLACYESAVQGKRIDLTAST